MSLTSLVSEIAETAAQLVQKQIDLATAEVRTDLRSELQMAKLVTAGGVAALVGLNLLVVAAVIAISMRLGVSVVGALFVAGIVVVLAAGVLGWLAWRRHVQNPLPATRRAVRKDVQWARTQTG